MSTTPVAEFQIRTYRPGEESKMADLVNRCRAFDFDGPVTIDMIRDEWSDPRLKLDRDTFVAINDDGDYIAVAEVWFNDPDNNEAVITRHLGFAMDPAYRESHPDVIDRLLQQALQHAQTHPFRHPEQKYVLRAWASANDTWKQNKILGLDFYLHHIGYTMVREGLESLPPLPDVPNVRFEPWSEERDPDVMDALNESFSADPSFVKLKWDEWQDLYHGARSNTSLWRLAIDESNDRIVGLALTEIDTETNADTGRKDGWIVDLAVRDEWRNVGIGRAVLLAAMHGLKEAGMSAVLMGVDSYDPEKATQLYEALGFRVMKGSRTYLKQLN
jgi:mycothiol synthase